MRAEIIAIGDEIISGRLLDTNTQWLSQRLDDLGIRVPYHTGLGDELGPIADAIRHAIDRAELIVVTGGLGPTDDDLTREAIAEATGCRLATDDAAMRQLREKFAAHGWPMPEQNARQALVPDGGHLIRNPHCTAPGIDLSVARDGRPPARVIALPGVPAEIREMWQDSVAATVRQMAGRRRVVLRRQIKCFGAGESQIESMLPGLIRRGRHPTVGICASQATIILRIAAEGSSRQECDKAIGPTLEEIREKLGNLIFGEDGDELQDAVVRLLWQHGKTLATVEWGTAGRVAQWLGAVDQAKGHYYGGLIASGRQSLTNTLGISPDVFVKNSPDSSEAVQAMAVACRERFGSDLALSVGPFPQLTPPASKLKTVQYALASADGVDSVEHPYSAHPALLKDLCAKRALNMVRLELLPQ